MSLNPKAFGLASGVFWGLYLFLLTIISAATDYASLFLGMLVDIYPGYSISYAGSLIGLVYGFLDGLVGCYVFALLYNYIERKK